MKLTRSWKQGQSLIEVLIAFAVITLVGMALITATLATQRTSISARSKSQATELAQQYLEQVRVIRDINGYDAFITGKTNGTCYVIQNSHLSDPSQWQLTNVSTLISPQLGGCGGTSPLIGEIINANNINYYRKITFSGSGTTSRILTIDVNWMESTNNRNISQQTIISKWCGGKVDPGVGVCPP